MRRAVRPALRVNARLDAETSEKLKYLMDRSGATVTMALKQAIETRYASLKAAETNRKHLLASLVGAFTGPPDLSTNYKQYLLEALEKKHGYR